MAFQKINTLCKEGEPFLFISDFKGEELIVVPLCELSQNDIVFSIERELTCKPHTHSLLKHPVPFGIYKNKFHKVIEKIKSGETYILNLTQPTLIETALSLEEIFMFANAPYKLRYKDKFVCFSPEKFIQIRENTIHTFPMKGTIDASIKNAKKKILANEKEMAEHVMIVDLLRNDLSMVAKNVRVESFRDVEKIQAGAKELLQVSSHICGDLEENWQEHFGDILQKLLPAGSISGAPKKSTCKIIDEVEGYERDFFSGVFGVFDGESVDSGVMIRFIEKQQDGSYIYKSGGGITLDSDVTLEYQEYQDKIYLP
jgi:para-aminobenzoate synthetase component 1